MKESIKYMGWMTGRVMGCDGMKSDWMEDGKGCDGGKLGWMMGVAIVREGGEIRMIKERQGTRDKGM